MRSHPQKKWQIELHENKGIFHHKKETITRGKRKLAEWEIIFVNYISDRKLISRTYRELQNKLSKQYMS